MATERRPSPSPVDAWGPLPPHAGPTRRRVAFRWIERALAVVALVSFGYCGYAWGEARLYQAYENRALDEILRSAPATTDPGGKSTSFHPAHPAAGSAIGRIDIARLGVSAIIRAGSDARTLQLAVGHIPGTALPGEPGNMGLAGHRDTFFRRLRDIQTGDHIRVVTPEGTFAYIVQRTNVVDPADVWVLDPTARTVLTLVTCYPFTYIGSAPQRFIVRAALETPQTERSEAQGRT